MSKKTIKYVFIKYRETWSSGRNEWSWMCMEMASGDTRDDIREFFNQKGWQYDWSEHWRGFEWKVIKNPPASAIEGLIAVEKKEIEYAQRRIECATVKIAMYEKLLVDRATVKITRYGQLFRKKHKKQKSCQ